MLSTCCEGHTESRTFRAIEEFRVLTDFFVVPSRQSEQTRGKKRKGLSHLPLRVTKKKKEVR